MPGVSRSLTVAAALVAAGLAGCGRSLPDPMLVERSHVSMGAEVRLTAWTGDEKGAVAAFDQVFEEFDRLDALLSVWKAGSDVLRVNAAAGRGAVAVGPEVLEILHAARQIGDWTGGKFDTTFGALSGLWRFDHDRDGRIPEPADVAARLPLIDYQKVVVDDRAGTVRLADPGMSLHLGGVGKGYAVERSAAILHAAGFHDFMIQSGGDLYAAGRRGGRPWRVGIQDPRGPSDSSFATLDLSDRALSTSGDYERFFIRDGVRYHHILDPDAGAPARGSRSVTVAASSSTLADGLSTGVFVMGPEAGMALIERLPGVEGVIVTADNRVLVSSGLRDRMLLLREPTDAP